MKHKNFISGAFTGIVLIAIVFVLGTAIFFVYRTFQKGVSADIFIYSRDLEYKVRRAAGTEYRRYFLLRDITKTLNFDLTDEDLRKSIESKADIFKSGGELPQMIESIGYYCRQNKEDVFEYVVDSGEWLEVKGLTLNSTNTGDLNITETRESGESDQIYISIDNGSDGGVLFRLDRAGFIDTYVKDAVENIEPKLKFEWTNPEDKTSLFEKEDLKYIFKPLRILFGIPSGNNTLSIEMPGFFDMKNIMGRNFVDENKAGVNEKHDRPPLMHTGIYVEISSEEGPFYYMIEQKAAINFIEALVILVIVGVLFFLLIIQLEKTRTLRKKEKEFVASVTHELRTPLTVIRSAADNLSNGIVPEKKLKIYARLISDQSDRLGNMIEEILLYSKFENKGLEHDKPELTDMKRLIGQAETTLEAFAEAESVNLKWDVSGLPAGVITYPEVLLLVLNNLVTNAVNHAYSFEGQELDSQNSGNEVRIKIKYIIPGKISVEVEDDGRGIEPRDLKHIFEPFFRDSISRSRQEKGSGLGLFIAKRKAHLAGGKLTVESPYRCLDGSRNSGCRFRLILSCTIPEADDGV